MNTSKRVPIFLLVVLAAAAILKVHAAPEQLAEVEEVPIVRLVADPERHHGKRVRIIGFIRLEFEGNAVYSYEADYRHSMANNGLWLDVDLGPKEAKKVDRMYGIIEGTFDAKNQGHFGMWSGAITKVTRLERWSDPAHPGRIPRGDTRVNLPGAPPPPPVAVRPKATKK